MVLDASLYNSGDEIINARIASVLSGVGWIADSAFYLGTEVSVSATGTGTSSGTATFTGTQVTSTSYVGAITGTVVDGSGVSHTGTFTGTYDLVDDVWVFTADEGWTWVALGTPVSNGNSVFTGVESFLGSGVWTGTVTGIIKDTLGSYHTGSFNGTLITADGQLTWTFTGDGWTSIVYATTVPVTFSVPTPPSFPTNIFYDYLLDVMTYSDYYAPQSNFTLSLTDTLVYSDYYDPAAGVVEPIALGIAKISLNIFDDNEIITSDVPTSVSAVGEVSSGTPAVSV